MIDPQTNKVLDHVEDLLKDRFSHYLVVAIDGDRIFSTYTHSATALGMAEFIRNEIKAKWNETIDEGEDDG